MAKRMNRFQKFRASTVGHIAEALFYAVLLILICLYFEGNGIFIYESL